MVLLIKSVCGQMNERIEGEMKENCRIISLFEHFFFSSFLFRDTSKYTLMHSIIISKFNVEKRYDIFEVRYDGKQHEQSVNRFIDLYSHRYICIERMYTRDQTNWEKIANQRRNEERETEKKKLRIKFNSTLLHSRCAKMTKSMCFVVDVVTLFFHWSHIPSRSVPLLLSFSVSLLLDYFKSIFPRLTVHRRLSLIAFLSFRMLIFHIRKSSTSNQIFSQDERWRMETQTIIINTSDYATIQLM